ncbi:serine/threonine protein kinase [Streptomyces sp. MUM 203J]|nr:serine/threonine-protein kinase [Streptomyces sp. MUM 203J]MCH0542232.1 serine/threonine protein kinase [Streptomyces sp. MUM 203J]
MQGTGAGLLLAGRYRLGESIGRGGMGRVWRAHDEVLHRTVAVKELTAGQYVSEADRTVLHARTQKEARAAARISHPSVVTVHDVLEHDDRPWIVMQYVDGQSLADAMKDAQDGGVDAREAARIGLHVLGALRAAHAAGVLHRDVKPGNVLLARDGRVLLTDFGIAAIEGDSTITRTGELVGSIDYLAPERVRGGDPGPASDLWALGATLYAAVEGGSPFRRTSPISTMQAVVTEEPPAPVRADALGPVITALLRKDPAARPDPAEAEHMFVEAMEGRYPAAAQAYVPTRTLKPGERDGDLTGAADGTATGAGGTAEPPGELTQPPTTRTASADEAGKGASSAAPGPRTPPPPPRPRRARRTALAVLAAALVGAGTSFAVLQYVNTGGAPQSVTAGPAGRPTGDPGTGSTADPVSGKGLEGWHRVQDPEGFSLLVPKGWERQLDGDQIDYTPDNGKHRIRVSVDRSPDFENPYMHMLDVERRLKDRLPEYRRIQLHANTFRDQLESCLWEFTWLEKKTHPGKRHAIDQVYYTDDGTEYALYMSSPEESWATTREQFDIVLRHWRPAEG